jgi:hypothetical protein
VNFLNRQRGHGDHSGKCLNVDSSTKCAARQVGFLDQFKPDTRTEGWGIITIVFPDIGVQIPMPLPCLRNFIGARKEFSGIGGMADDIIQQLRSRFRLRLTAIIGGAITATSVLSLAWLLSIWPWAQESERATIDVRIIAECPRPVRTSVHIDPIEERIWIRLEDPAISPNVSDAERNALKRAFFQKCYVTIDSRKPLISAAAQTQISGDRISPSSGTQKPFALQLDTTTEGIAHSVEVARGEIEGFAGHIQLRPKKFFQSSRFDRFHMGVAVHASNEGGITGLDVAVSLPNDEMQADVIRPLPQEVRITPAETYYFAAAPSPYLEENWINRNYYVEFYDPAASQLREVLLIIASTLFGAGISALLEVFLAGGTSALLRKSDEREPNQPRDLT